MRVIVFFFDWDILVSKLITTGVVTTFSSSSYLYFSPSIERVTGAFLRYLIPDFHSYIKLTLRVCARGYGFRTVKSQMIKLIHRNFAQINCGFVQRFAVWCSRNINGENACTSHSVFNGYGVANHFSVICDFEFNLFSLPHLNGCLDVVFREIFLYGAVIVKSLYPLHRCRVTSL